MKYAAALAVVLCAWPLTTTAMAVTIKVGSGPLTSHFVLESPNVGTRVYDVHYGNGGPTPVDAYDLFDAILAADPLVSATVWNFGSAQVPNYFIAGITFGGVTEANTALPPYAPSWTHWVAGGEAGFPAAAPVPSGSWSQGSGISAPFRFVEPGSWDALVYADFETPPGVRPISSIPDSGGIALCGIAALAIGFFRRILPQ